MFRSHLALSTFSLTLAACASSPPPTTLDSHHDDATVLPLARVRLYASGVGYFERQGDLRGAGTSLPIPSGHLDDALKSLVLLGPDSQPLAVSFPSRLSPAVARARAGLPAGEDAALSFDRLLAALRGEEVEVTRRGHGKVASSEPIRGRVVEVVAIEPSHPSYDHGPPGRTLPDEHTEAEEHQRLQVVLLSEAKGLLRLDLTEIGSVKPVNPAIARRFETALSARVASRTSPTQWLDLVGGEELPETVTLGYLAETPTWRTSYRLILDSDAKDKKAALQAWALIHNDTDEPWKNVKLELAEGRPSSFLYPLAAPRYHRREIETPDEELSSVPQLSTQTPDAMWGDFSDYQGETVPIISGTTLGHGGGTGSGQGFGSGHGRLGGSHRTRSPRIGVLRSGASDLLWLGNLARRAGLTTTTAQAISVFSVEQELTLPPQHSATLPFLNARLSARPIVWFGDFGEEAERAVSISNDTANTLPAGPLSVFGDGGFWGEAMLSSLQPGARQFSRISSEQDVELAASLLRTTDERRHVDFRGGLGVHSIETKKHRLVFANRTGRQIEVFVGLPIVANATVEGSESIDFDSTTGRPYAVFSIPPGKRSERTITVREALERSVAIEIEALDELIADTRLPEREREILKLAKTQVAAQDELEAAKQELSIEKEAASASLTRLQTQVNALSSKESGEAQTTLVSRILAHHDRINAMQSRERELTKKLERAEQAIDDTLNGLDAFRDELRAKRKAKQSAQSKGR